MTPEPPLPPARRHRPDTGFRRRALETPGRESFRDALSRIPDLDEVSETPIGPPDPVDPVVPPAEAAAETAPQDAPEEATGPLVAAVAAAAARSQAARGSAPGVVATADGPRPPRPPWWRRLAFAAAIVALVASIPGLSYAGYHLVSQSTDGKTGPGAASPSEPGYQELVASTPTALLIQNDATGIPINLTFLSLAGDKGGSVIFIPLDTMVRKKAFGIDRLRSSYAMTSAGHDAGIKQLVLQTAALLNVGIDEVLELDDAGWSRMTAPVAPLKIFNTDPLDLLGTSMLSGDTAVPANLVGPYLAATRPGEDDTSRFPRQQELLRSWFAAVAASNRPDAVPGETGTGLGFFARTFSAGEVTYNTLPGQFFTIGKKTLYARDDQGIRDLIGEAVPAPDPAFPGSRTTVRLLNGVAAAPIPHEITRKVVQFQGSVSVVGNGPSFGTAKTSIIYVDPRKRAFAELLFKELGATGVVRRDPQGPDNVDLTVILGKDLLGDQVATTTTSTPAGQPGLTSTTAAPTGGT